MENLTTKRVISEWCKINWLVVELSVASLQRKITIAAIEQVSRFRSRRFMLG